MECHYYIYWSWPIAVGLILKSSNLEKWNERRKKDFWRPHLSCMQNLEYTTVVDGYSESRDFTRLDFETNLKWTGSIINSLNISIITEKNSFQTGSEKV